MENKPMSAEEVAYQIVKVQTFRSDKSLIDLIKEALTSFAEARVKETEDRLSKFYEPPSEWYRNRIEEARNAALEQAATVAIEFIDLYRGDGQTNTRIAESIRQLKAGSNTAGEGR